MLLLLVLLVLLLLLLLLILLLILLLVLPLILLLILLRYAGCRLLRNMRTVRLPRLWQDRMVYRLDSLRRPYNLIWPHWPL
jgi:hypothetical protein